MNITIVLNSIEEGHLSSTLSGYLGPTAPKLGNINPDAEEDSEFLPLDHYDEVAISAFIDFEMGGLHRNHPRMPRQATGLFRDADGKYVALSDRESNLLAVYLIHRDGSMKMVTKIPDVIKSVYN